MSELEDKLKKKRKQSAARTKKFEDKQRDQLKRVQRKRWANALDWPRIDEFIAQVNSERDKQG